MYKKRVNGKKLIVFLTAALLLTAGISASAGSLQDAKNAKNKLELRKQEIEHCRKPIEIHAGGFCLASFS